MTLRYHVYPGVFANQPRTRGPYRALGELSLRPITFESRTADNEMPALPVWLT